MVTIHTIQLKLITETRSCRHCIPTVIYIRQYNSIHQLLLLLHPFNSLFSRTTWLSWYQKAKTSLDLNKARDDGRCSGISWTIRKQSAPHSRQITMPAPHLSVFKGRMPFLPPNQQCQSTEGIHQRHCILTTL